MAYVNLQALAFEAFAHVEKKEFDAAETKISYILNISPDECILYYYMGCLYHSKKQWALAVMSFEKALEYQPDFDECLNNLGTCYRHLGRLDLSIISFTHAVKIAQHSNYIDKCNNDAERANRNLADYLTNLGSCYIASGCPDKSIEHISESLKILPNLPNSMWNIGLAYLEKGDYEKGFEGYAYQLQQKEFKMRNFHGQKKQTPVWPGPIEGQRPTVVVYGEQGIGDEIMFASIVKDAIRDADIILECHPRLLDLFRESFPTIPIYGTRKAIEVSWLKNHTIDYQIPLSQLGQFYRKKKDDFRGAAYIRNDEELESKVAAKYLLPLDVDGIKSRKPKIGISWKGGIGATNKASRCIPLATLKPLFEFDADFISLQYHTNAQAEIDAFNEANGDTVITHWQDVVDDYDLTAALLPSLDLIISVPQSVVHLAGSLGVETIQMCPIKALWQMGPYGEDMPWYNCVKNLWQLMDGNWDTVVANVVMELERKGFKRK